MKKTILYMLVLGLLASLESCKQNNINPEPDNSVLNITNAVIGGATVNLTAGTAPYLTSGNNAISSNNYAFLPIPAGNIPITIAVPASAATSTSAAIPSVIYYNNNVNVSANSNYSLFLTGSSPSAVDNVLVQENYARSYADSVCGVRFINLSPGSNPVSVNVKGNANGSEVSNLAYKAYSNFNQHPAKKVNSSYVFEFRDQATGTLLTSYTLTTPYFHNVTLCLRGATGSYGVILDKDF